MTTPTRRDLRRLAMQVLYQLDVNSPNHNPGHAPKVRASAQELADQLDEEHDTEATRVFAAELALQAWVDHAEADEQATHLAPDWPTHRQPPVDRAILRLAYYEMKSGHAPVKVAINEAIELAKQFGSENSPAFINGILDKLAKNLNAPPPPAGEENPETSDPLGVAGDAQHPSAAPTKPTDPDAWLDDAIEK
ncbi:MAG: transcription antitermination factor NusB [Phycisphaeraceae bacterium]